MSKVIRSPRLEEVLRIALESRLADVHVALPGRVETYDDSEQTVDVKPLIKRNVIDINGNETVESLPVIRRVPVAFLRSSRFFISFPMEKGDHVMLIFSERSIDNYMTGDGSEVDPVDLRKHSLSDAVAYPGVYPDVKKLKNADASDMVLGKDDGIRIHIRDDQVEVLDGAIQQSVAVAEKLQALYTTLKTTFDTHVHPTGTGPSGPTSTPFPAYDTDINSNKVKIPGN
jgi:hypothetical protein